MLALPAIGFPTPASTEWTRRSWCCASALLASPTRARRRVTRDLSPTRGQHAERRSNFGAKPVISGRDPSQQNGQNDAGVHALDVSSARAEVIGTFFSSPARGSPEPESRTPFARDGAQVLDDFAAGPARNAKKMDSQAFGIDLVAIADAPPPAEREAQRMVQMRSLTHDFSATTQDDKETRHRSWRCFATALRICTTPDPAVLGRSFDVLRSANRRNGPRRVLLDQSAGRKPQQSSLLDASQYGVGRFTDMNVWVPCARGRRSVREGAMSSWQDAFSRIRNTVTGHFATAAISLVEEAHARESDRAPKDLATLCAGRFPAAARLGGRARDGRHRFADRHATGASLLRAAGGRRAPRSLR